MGAVVFLLLVVLLLAALPTWPYSRRWGYGPGGFVALLLILCLALIIFSVLPWWGYPSG